MDTFTTVSGLALLVYDVVAIVVLVWGFRAAWCLYRGGADYGSPRRIRAGKQAAPSPSTSADPLRPSAN